LAFQLVINQGQVSPLTSPWGSYTQICSFFRRHFDQKTIESATELHCLKTSSRKLLRNQLHISNDINILDGDHNDKAFAINFYVVYNTCSHHTMHVVTLHIL